MNKRNYFLSFLLILSCFSSLSSQQNYCASKGNTPWTEWIANVQFGTINNTSSKEGYGNFTSQTTTVTKGTSYPLSILQGFSWAADPTNATQQGKVWIDYNQNGIFEDAELAASFTRTTVTANITIPTTALTGATRMRVSLKTIGAPTACEVFEKGEVEDYSVNITGGTVSAPPKVVITNVTGPTTAAPGSQITLAVTVTNTGTTPTVPTKLYYRQNGVSASPLPLTNDTATIAPLAPNETRVINYIFTLKNPIYPPNANYLVFGFSPYSFADYYVVASNETLYYGDTSQAFKFNITPIFPQANILVNVIPSKTILQRQEKWNAVYTVKNNSNTLVKQIFVNLGTFNSFGRNYIAPNYQIDSVGSLPANSLFWSSGGEYRTVGLEVFDLAAGETRELKLFFSNVLTYADFVTQYLDTSRTTLPFPKVNTFSNVVNTNTTVGADIKIVCYPQISATLPDLAIVNYNVPTPSVQQGQILNFNFDLINVGAVTATGNFNIKSYLSKDVNLSADDYQDGIVPTANLGASVITRGVAGAMTVSNAVPAGQYYLILKVDADNQIAESNENNNVIVSYNLITVTSVVNNSCRFQDSLQLVRLYNATNGANWRTKWNLNTPIDTWAGISVNPDGCVRTVVLPNNNLVGTLPNLNLPNVIYFGLDDNKIGGTMPNLSLPNLTQLFLSKNQLNGAIPNFNFPNVTDIYLGENQLSGTIPNFNLPKLTGLFLYNNQLSGAIPNFNFLPNLKSLVLYTNQLSGSIPNFNIPTLVTLVIDSNRLSGAIPNFSLPNLVNLSLVNNQLSGSIPSFNLPLLSYLHVEKNQLSGCIPLALKSLCGKNVDISSNPNLATQDFAAFCSANITGACNVSTSYCAAKGTAPWEYWVGNVSLGTINNASDKFKDFATLGYSDYTSLSATLNKGTSYPLSISPGLSWIGNVPNAYCRVWIDFNQNKTFEANELVLEKTNQNPLTQSVLIPTTALIGNTRMRVALKFGAYPTACEMFDKGEVEDYTVNIQAPPTTSCADLSISIPNFYATEEPRGPNDLPYISLVTTLRIKNSGTIASTPTKMSYDIATDSSATTFVYGGVLDIPAIAAGATYDVVFNGTAKYPGFVDARYLVATLNFPNPVFNPNPLAECNYTNNHASVQLTNTAIVPDLVLANLTIPTPSVQQGQILNFKVDAKNIGTGAATGNFKIFSHLSVDPILSVDDYFDGIILTGNVAAGFSAAQVPGAMTVKNTVLPGQYFLIVTIDGENVIAEGNESNNRIVSTSLVTVISISTPLPDIRITNIVPAGADWLTTTFKAGDAAGLSVTVVNGNNVTPGPLETTFYLSADNVLDAGDAISSVWTTGTNETFHAGVVIPNLVNGDYFVIAKTNSNNAIQESNTANNVFVMQTPVMKIRNTTGSADLALSITATPSVFKKYTTHSFRVTAQNVGNQTLTNVKIELKRPALTSNGGSKVASVGTFSDFCPGGIECSEWRIPSLAAGATATLDAPFFILDATTSIVATTKLLSSTPVDGNATNNTASVTVNPAPSAAPILALSRQKPTQYIPLIVQSIAPNPSEGDVVVEVESLTAQEVQFEFSNAMGQTIQSEKRHVEKGTNRVQFDVYEFTQGVYFIQTNVGKGRNAPTKFVKF
jgi:GEVED domain/Domain of unknown function DUF11/CARDB/Secretion system C-terminal sorting domain